MYSTLLETMLLENKNPQVSTAGLRGQLSRSDLGGIFRSNMRGARLNVFREMCFLVERANAQRGFLAAVGVN